MRKQDACDIFCMPQQSVAGGCCGSLTPIWESHAMHGTVWLNPLRTCLAALCCGLSSFILCRGSLSPVAVVANRDVSEDLVAE